MALQAHSDHSRVLVDAWSRADVPGFLEAAYATEQGLDRLDQACRLGIGGGGIAEARRAIVDAGAVARTSGAGGGDCIWVLGSEPGSIRAAIKATVALGCRYLELELAAPGLSVAEIRDAE